MKKATSKKYFSKTIGMEKIKAKQQTKLSKKTPKNSENDKIGEIILGLGLVFHLLLCGSNHSRIPLKAGT